MSRASACRLFTVQGTHSGRNHAGASVTPLCPCLHGGKDEFADWHRGTVPWASSGPGGRAQGSQYVSASVAELASWLRCQAGPCSVDLATGQWQVLASPSCLEKGGRSFPEQSAGFSPRPTRASVCSLMCISEALAIG